MKKIQNILYLLFFIYITLQVIINISVINSSIIEVFKLWLYQLFPNLFPFLILSDFLINYNFVYYLNIIFDKLFYKAFKINNAAYVFFLSMLSGFPSNSKYINELYNNKLIDEVGANKLLTFTHFSSPLFIMGFLKNYIGFKYALIILIVHYTSNIIVGLLFRNIKCCSKSGNNNFIKPFSSVLKTSIKKAIDTLLTILGTIAFAIVLNAVLMKTNLPFKNVFLLFLELTTGINNVLNMNLLLSYKLVLISMILSFGGISIHLQVLSLVDFKIKYQQYLLSRILHSLIAGLLVFVVVQLI